MSTPEDRRDEERAAEYIERFQREKEWRDAIRNDEPPARIHDEETEEEA